MLPEVARHSEKFIYFYEIALNGSLQATSRKLGISAPSLSHSIKELESVMGTTLFIRSKTGVKLTEAGEKFYIFCRKYFRELEEVQRIIATSDAHPQTKIKIGTFESIALYLWPLLMDSLKKDNSLSLSIKTNRSKVILESLIKREIDLALTVETLTHQKLIRHELYKDDYAFFVPSHWKKTEFTKDELSDIALLYIPDAVDESGKSLTQFVHSWGMSFKDEFELDSLEVIGEFVLKGYGIGILPLKVAKTYGKALSRVKIEGMPSYKFGTHRFFLSYRDDLDLPQSLMKNILQSAQKAVHQLNS